MPWESRNPQELPQVIGQTYNKAQVGLDGVSYQNCVFNDCHLIYRGGPARFVSCRISSGCVWEFSDAAACVMQTLTDLGWKIAPPGELSKLNTSIS
ncbi:MAG: hypothetical protein DMG97_35455 [Acidobacteria bacterium]|nr:MAG: hypothetical protein DMG97_35455 [Acidobacteriota bacterium]